MGDRLTEKLNKRYATARKNLGLDYSAFTDLVYGGSVIDKLGKLEDIEEELGIDLKIIFRALKQGYIETRVCKLTNIVLAYDEYIKNWCFYEIDEGGYGKGWLLEDYGKTWALTKEELE